MALSYDLISQFAKVVNSDKKQSTETTIFGTVVDQHGKKPGDVDKDGNKVVIDETGGKYIKPDGSDQLIPITENSDDIVNGTTTTNTDYGDRTSVLIKDHTATVTGNISSPAVNNKAVETQISEFDIAVGEQLQAERGYFKDLTVDKANMGNLVAAIISVAELIAKKAEIENLVAEKATVTDLIATKIDTDVVIASNAIVQALKADSADILSLFADKATIENLIANNADISILDAINANMKYATIDFANISEAAVNKIFADYGIINELIIGEGTVVKELVGVTIKGDLIETGTLKADRLVVKGTDGNYYALSTDFTALPGGVEPVEEEAIHGSALIKKSITAEKIAVDDLVAFGATIGRFHITEDAETDTGSIYSGSKASVDSNNPGIYIDSTGQMALGNDSSFLKFYKDENDKYKLRITVSAGLSFDEDGLIVEKNDGKTKTNIAGDGIKVYTDNPDNPTLLADPTGVKAANLHATTYAIFGDNSRFENYGKNRTGCFWFGN